MFVRRHQVHAQPIAVADDQKRPDCHRRRAVRRRRVRRPRQRRHVETYGFGVRVIHGGVWGFASSPLVTPEEIKRVAATATEIARASAVAKKTDVRLAPVEKYDEYWQMPFEKDPWSVPLEQKVELLRTVTNAIQKTRAFSLRTPAQGSRTNGSSSRPATARSSSSSSTSATATRRRRRVPAPGSKPATTSARQAADTNSWSSPTCPRRPSGSRRKRSNIRRPSRSGRA